MRSSIVAGCAAALILLAGCAGTPAPQPTSTETGGTGTPTGDPLVAAATEAAKRVVGDQKLEGKVTLLGALGGEQLDQYMSVLKPFEDVSGVKVEYEGTRDMGSVLQTRIQGNNPPDVVSSPSIGQMRQLMAEGHMLALSDFIDMDGVKQDYDQGLIDLASHDGTMYGIWQTAALKGLVYYNPKTYQGPTAAKDWAELNNWAKEFAATGTAPWCIGVESGAASGWLATDWIEQFVLTTYGTEVWDKWAAGELPWTSPEIKASFESFGAIATDKTMVNGGPTAVLSTDFTKGALPLWADPPRCALTLQADWLGATVASQVPGTVEGESIAFFQFPAVDTANTGLIETAGEMVGAFNDRPEVRALMQYMATAESQSLLAATGSWLSPNRNVPADVYPTPARQEAAKIFTGASGVRFDASDLMPAEVNSAFWAATLKYIGDPSKLDEALAGVEKARLANQ